MSTKKTIIDHILGATVPVRVDGELVGIAHIAKSGTVTRRYFDEPAAATWHGMAENAKMETPLDDHLVRQLTHERAVREELATGEFVEAAASTLKSAQQFC